MQNTCAIFVDAGTTNTRVWLARGEEILARANTMVGVRDSAREGNTVRLQAALRDLITEVRTQNEEIPSCVIAAGMITSALGLKEIPHLAAPAGVSELAAATQMHSFPNVTELPVLLAPGIRSGDATCDENSVAEVDIMRGEETLCIGLAKLALAALPCTILNLGSHWKAIQIDSAARVQSSVTTLTGELILAAQTNTILASAVPHERPAIIVQQWAEAGMREQKNAGLARALFCVRLLEQKSTSTPEERLSFLVGAFVAADLEGFRKQGVFTPEKSVLITGGGALAELWLQTLTQENIVARILSAEEVERALLTGLREILTQSKMF